MKKIAKKLGLTIMTMILTFMLTAPNIVSAGIFVDEEANPVAEDAVSEEETATTPVEPDSEQPTKKPEVKSEEPAAEQSKAQAEQQEKIAQAVAKVNPLEGQSNPFVRQMDGLLSGTASVMDTKLARGASLSSGKGNLDIGQGSISINQTGYTYGNIDEPSYTGVYNVTGITASNPIVIESGTITMHVTDISIDLTGVEGMPAIHVKSGATLHLVLANSTTPGAASTLMGGKFASAIQVEADATLNVSGAGTLYAKGGASAAGIGGDQQVQQGGRIVFADQAARVIAYSDNTGGALNMTSVSATKAKLVQGVLNATTVSQAEQTVVIENRDDVGEAYPLKIPAGYSSFAVTTTTRGGEYISYIPGQQVSGKLLGMPTGAHVYNLLNANEVATLTDLTSQTITYTVTLHANTGKFNSTGLPTALTQVNYGGQVASPEEPVKSTNNTVEGWYRNIEGTGQKWNFGTDAIVKDTTLYVKWKPNKCYIKFVPGYAGGLVIDKEYTYEQKIPKSDVPAVTNGDKVLGGWYTNTTPPVRWDFDNDVVTKENITLTANWLNEYAVTFNQNTKDEVQNMPNNTKVTQGMTISPKEPTRDKWVFIGWYTDSNATKPWNISTDTVKAATTLYAGWAVETCTVKYETGQVDGTQGSAVADAAVNYNMVVPKPQNVTMAERTGTMPTTYSVEGWYTDQALTKKWNFQTQLVSRTATMTLYAKWHQNTCYVTYDGNEGTTEIAGGNQEAKVTKGFDYKQSAEALVFTRAGYDLTHWTKSGARYDMATPLTGDIELVAAWAIKSYDVTFDTKGGSPNIAPKRVQYATKVPAVTAPKKPGYVFDNWYSTETYESDSEWDFATTTMPNKDVTLYAKWNPIQYMVLYESNDGVPEPAVEEDLEYSSAVTAVGEVTKAHHEFNGWYTKADFTGVKWDFDKHVVGDAKEALVEDEPSLTGSLTLYAKWTPDTYEVLFDSTKATCAKGETVPDIAGNQKKQKAVYNTALKRPLYPEDEWKGHTLVGWYGDSDFAEESKWSFKDEPEPTPIDADKTLYAKWQCHEYRTYYVVEDEEPAGSADVYHYGEKVTKPADPVKKENYEFEGWYTDVERSAENKWDFAKNKIEKDTTFYAKYLGEPRKLNVYITYEEGNPKYDKPIKQVRDVRYGDQLALADIVNEENEHTKKRPGYTLTGWTIDKEGLTEWNFELDRIGGSATEETNLYGVWSRDKYDITFETYEGDPSPVPTQIGEYEDKVTKPDPDPTRTHYQFEGWYKDKKLETVWNFDTELIYGPTTIYAKWKPNVYQLQFETNGGNKLPSVEVEYGTLIPEEALATKKAGYYIAGWYRNAEFTQPFDVTKDFVDADKLKLYVRWELENYTVKYLLTDEVTNEQITEVDPKTYHVGDKLKKPVFAKEHMTLNGWFQDAGHQDKWVFKRDKIKGDTTIYAYWTETLYKVHFETYGGTQIPDQELVWGSQFEAPADPVKAGYTFTGWYTDGSYSTMWSFEEDFVDGDTNIYAGWSANSYTVTFEGDGGEPVPEPMILPFGSLIPKPEDPLKEGFTFGGWTASDKANKVWNFETDTMPEDVTLTATWEAVVPPEPPAPPEDKSATPAQPTPKVDDDKLSAVVDAATKAVEELKKAATNIAKVMTGDEAPLLWSIVGVMLGAIVMVRMLIKKMK